MCCFPVILALLDAWLRGQPGEGVFVTGAPELAVGGLPGSDRGLGVGTVVDIGVAD